MEAQVQLYKNFVDSNAVPIEQDVTCLVGKNESGKTALLRALYNLNPAYAEEVDLDLTEDYPRWRRTRDSRQGSLGEFTPVRGVFELEVSDRESLAEIVGFEPPEDLKVLAERNYNQELLVNTTVDEASFVGWLVDRVSLEEEKENAVRSAGTVGDLKSSIKAARAETPKEDREALTALKDLASLANGAGRLLDRSDDEISEVLLERLPRFFYFSDYSNLVGRLDLTDLLNKAPSRMRTHERTALSLLKLAGVDGEEFTSENFEYRVAELEAAANSITQEVFEYWKQNEDLMVSLVADAEAVPAQNGQSIVHRYVDVRLNDLRHQVTTNLDRRSAGFRWFFSFIAGFSEFERNQGSVVVLLDEPGLNLHAKAQNDFVRFIDERLASGNQVLYTTHSPFMVEPTKLHRVRLLEDHSTRRNPDAGARVSRDVLSVHGDTIFPLQGALGYDLAQNLFVGGRNLVVEGTSDLVYLEVLSEHLASIGREGLRDGWTIVPVGGADKIPTFAALLGARLDVTILLDSNGTANQRLMDLAEEGILDPNRIITVGSVTGTKRADIEDLFEASEYVTLYNAAFGADLDADELAGNDPILKRIERHIDSNIDHRRPSTELLRTKERFFEGLGNDTKDRFESLFSKVNATLDETPL